MKLSELAPLCAHLLLTEHENVRAGSTTRKNILNLIPNELKTFNDATFAISILGKTEPKSKLFGKVVEKACTLCFTPSEVALINSVLIREKLSDLQNILLDRVLEISEAEELNELLENLPSNCRLATEINYTLTEMGAS